jgi:hypothetical protein
MGNPVIKPIDDQEKESRNLIETELRALSRKNTLPKAMSGASLYMTHFSLQFSNQPVAKSDASTCYLLNSMHQSHCVELGNSYGTFTCNLPRF